MLDGLQALLDRNKKGANTLSRICRACQIIHSLTDAKINDASDGDSNAQRYRLDSAENRTDEGQRAEHIKYARKNWAVTFDIHAVRMWPNKQWASYWTP